MFFRDLTGLAALALICVSACGGKAAQSGAAPGNASPGQEGVSSSDTNSQSDSGAAAALAACSWPANLDPADGAVGTNGQCVAARAFLSCRGNSGGAECLSNDPTQCPGGSTPGFTCTNLCNADEYAVGCGGPGPGPWPSPPAGCRGVPGGSGPGGGTSVCCPCGQPAPPPDMGNAGSFACGSTATCDGRSQVCEHVEGGVPPGVDQYDCIPIPSTCTSDVSCACVTTALRGRGAGQCSAVGNNITVQIDVP